EIASAKRLAMTELATRLAMMDLPSRDEIASAKRLAMTEGAERLAMMDLGAAGEIASFVPPSAELLAMTAVLIGFTYLGIQRY
ncbi:MAG: hypothetical protein AB1644_12355, partial [Candidatus Zixiibacteriota bacterium]